MTETGVSPGSKAMGRLQGLALVLAAVVLVADQLSKWLIVDVVLAERRFVEVTSFFNIVLVYNRGVSFGIFADGAATWQPWVLSGLAIAISLGLLYWLWQVRHWLPATAIEKMSRSEVAATRTSPPATTVPAI